jgi:hypothetical protein
MRGTEIRNGMLAGKFIEACQERLARDLTQTEKKILLSHIKNAESQPLFSTLEIKKLERGVVLKWNPPVIKGENYKVG